MTNFEIDDRVAFPTTTFCSCSTGTVIGKESPEQIIVQLDEPDVYNNRARLMWSGVLTKQKGDEHIPDQQPS